MTPAWREFFDGRRVVQLVALLLAVAAAAFLLGVPVYQGVSTSVGPDGTMTTTQDAATLLEIDGRGVLGVVLAPVVLTAVPVFWVGHGRAVVAIVCTGLLGLLCVAGLLTIGVFSLPAAITAALAFVARTRPAGGGMPRESAGADPSAAPTLAG